ncbi:hypothetical protein D3C75_686170 [compost metagenome]
MTERYALNQEGISGELKLLLKLLQSDAAPEDKGDELEVPASMDWKLFVRLAVHHRVFPYIYPRISRLGPGVPPEVVQVLQTEYRRNTVQMLQLCAEMRKLADELAAEDIRAIFLKGPVLAQELYGDLSLRTSRDLDFVVPITGLEKAEALLVAQGYVKEEEFESIMGDWKWRQHHMTFHHPVRMLTAEVHWRMNPAPSKEPGFDELWKRRRTSGPMGRNVHFLGDEDLFMYLAAHGARHGWSRLRWLLDIRQMLLRAPDAGRLVGLLRRYHYSDVGGQTLILAAGLLNAPVDAGFAVLTQRPKAVLLANLAMFYIVRTVNLHHPPLPPDVDRHYRHYQPAILPFRQRVVYALGFLHPYAADAKTLPLPHSLYFLYFPLRPFLWAWRKATDRQEEAPAGSEQQPKKHTV